VPEGSIFLHRQETANCDNCGEKKAKFSLYCTNCGYSLDKVDLPAKQAETAAATSDTTRKHNGSTTSTFIKGTSSNGKISSGLYGVILLTFLLPFLTVSCEGQNMGTITGMDMVTGTSVQGQAMDPNPLVIVILMLTLVGIGLGFWVNAKRPLLSSITGAAGLILTFVTKVVIDNELAKEGRGLFQAQYKAGFYLMLILFLIAAVYNGYLVSRRE